MWEDADGAGPGSPTQMWTVYNGVNAYADFNSNGSLTTRYIFGNGVDQLLGRIRAGQVNWYLTDNLGSVQQIVDSSGTVLDQIGYSAFGNITSETNPANGDRFTFTGRELDRAVGQYYYRARFYNADDGRFTSEDPLSFGGGDADLYRYVHNSPANATDPSGRLVVDFFGQPVHMFYFREPQFSLSFQQARDRGVGSAPFGPPPLQQQGGQQQIAQQQMGNQQLMMANWQGAQQQVGQFQLGQAQAQQPAAQQQGGASWQFWVYGTVGAAVAAVAAAVVFVGLAATSPGWVPILVVASIAAAVGFYIGSQQTNLWDAIWKPALAGMSIGGIAAGVWNVWSWLKPPPTTNPILNEINFYENWIAQNNAFVNGANVQYEAAVAAGEFETAVFYAESIASIEQVTQNLLQYYGFLLTL